MPDAVRQARRRHDGGASAWGKYATYSVNLEGRGIAAGANQSGREGPDPLQLANKGLSFNR